MPLECVMLLLDNSSYSRNGDALPSRFQAQLDAASSLINYKTNDNMETFVGLMSTAGNGNLLATPTNEASALYSLFGKVTIGGTISLARSLQIASLALKHRVNKNQKERIIVFISSEIKDAPEDLFVVAKNLRRNNTSVDIVNICSENNLRLLQQFFEIVNVGETSKLINYQGGLSLLSDALKSGGLLGGTTNDDGGFQEEVDPELEMVLRISMEEEKRRLEELERQQQAQNQQGGMLVEESADDKIQNAREKGDEEENEALISKTSNFIESESKGKSAMEIENDKSKQKDNDYIKDPAFIKEILKDLQIDSDDRKKKDDEKKKDDDKDKNNNK